MWTSLPGTEIKTLNPVQSAQVKQLSNFSVATLGISEQDRVSSQLIAIQNKLTYT